MDRKLLYLIAFLFCCNIVCAQQVVSSGGYSVKSDYTVNWILGGSLSDMQINNEAILEKLRSEEMIDSKISLKVYPIPVGSVMNLELTPSDTGRISLELYNNLGIKIFSKAVPIEHIIQIDVSEIPSGIYFLRAGLYNNDELYSIKKIVKN
jgi:hypothetical protein